MTIVEQGCTFFPKSETDVVPPVSNPMVIDCSEVQLVGPLPKLG